MNGLKITIITWNLGLSIKHIHDWTTELKSWTIFDKTSDIIFITLQESTSNVCNQIHTALIKILDQYDIFYKGEGSNIPTLSYYVCGYLCIKKSIVARNQVAINTIKLNEQTVCITKSGVCTKPTIGIAVQVFNKNLLFIGSHLPVDTKLDDMGYLDRVKAINEIKHNIIDVLSGKIGEFNNIFWAGDMNFRISSNNIDQLDTAMNKIPALRQFYEYTRNFKPTCRYIEMQPDDPKIDQDDYIDSRLYDLGYDDKRIPSHCDRVIYSGKVGIAEYSSYPVSEDDFPLAIRYSDHNPVVLKCIVYDVDPALRPKHWNISVNDIFGDSDSVGYEKQYLKYKSKYCKLKGLI